MYKKKLLEVFIFLNFSFIFSSEPFLSALDMWHARNSVIGQWSESLLECDDRYYGVSGQAYKRVVDPSFYECPPNGTAAKILNCGLMPLQSITCAKKQNEEFSKRDETLLKTYRKAPSTAFKRKSSQSDDHHFSDYSLLPIEKVPCFFEQGPPISSDFMRKVFSKKYLSTIIELFFKSHERNCSSRTEALLMFMVSYDYLLQSGLRSGMIEVDETIVKDKKKDFLLGTSVSLYLSGLPLDQIKIMHLLNQKSQDWVFSTPSNLIAVAKIISSYLYNISYPFSLEKQDLKLYQGLALFSKEWQKNKLEKFFMNEVRAAAQEKIDYQQAHLPE